MEFDILLDDLSIAVEGLNSKISGDYRALSKVVTQSTKAAKLAMKAGRYKEAIDKCDTAIDALNQFKNELQSSGAETKGIAAGNAIVAAKTMAKAVLGILAALSVAKVGSKVLESAIALEKYEVNRDKAREDPDRYITAKLSTSRKKFLTEWANDNTASAVKHKKKMNDTAAEIGSLLRKVNGDESKLSDEEAHRLMRLESEVRRLGDRFKGNIREAETATRQLEKGTERVLSAAGHAEDKRYQEYQMLPWKLEATKATLKNKRNQKNSDLGKQIKDAYDNNHIRNNDLVSEIERNLLTIIPNTKGDSSLDGDIEKLHKAIDRYKKEQKEENKMLKSTGGDYGKLVAEKGYKPGDVDKIEFNDHGLNDIVKLSEKLRAESEKIAANREKEENDRKQKQKEAKNSVKPGDPPEKPESMVKYEEMKKNEAKIKQQAEKENAKNRNNSFEKKENTTTPSSSSSASSAKASGLLSGKNIAIATAGAGVVAALGSFIKNMARGKNANVTNIIKGVDLSIKSLESIKAQCKQSMRANESDLEDIDLLWDENFPAEEAFLVGVYDEAFPRDSVLESMLNNGFSDIEAIEFYVELW